MRAGRRQICRYGKGRAVDPKSGGPRYTGRGTGGLPRFIWVPPVMFMARSDFRTPVESLGPRNQKWPCHDMGCGPAARRYSFPIPRGPLPRIVIGSLGQNDERIRRAEPRSASLGLSPQGAGLSKLARGGANLPG
jgi:hypothetical protein